MSSRAPDVVVVGLGYLGLPPREAAAAAQLTVAGLDIDAERVATVNVGQAVTDDVSAEAMAKLVAAGFAATTDPGVVANAGRGRDLRGLPSASIPATRCTGWPTPPR